MVWRAVSLPHGERQGHCSCMNGARLALVFVVPLLVLATAASCASNESRSAGSGDDGGFASNGQADGQAPNTLTLPDGAVVIVESDGSLVTVSSDGAPVNVAADGAPLNGSPDGSPVIGDSAPGGSTVDAPVVVGPPPISYVHVSGRAFVFPGGAPGGFIGVNSAGLSHYGTPLLAYSTQAQIDQQLAAIQSIGGRVVRVFAAGNDAADSTQAARLGAVLDAAKNRGIYVIACLTDFYSTSYHPVGDDGYYEPDSNNVVDLTDTWFQSGYTTDYRSWVDKIVSALRNHPALLAWEIGNELKDVGNPGAFLTFATTMGARIRAADPNHLITTGIISTRNGNLRAAGDLSTSTLAYQLVSSSSFDFLTTHDYRGDMTEDDTDLAALVGKPLIIEEMGYESADGDRGALTLANGGAWKQRGASGYMQWGFLATGQDNGDGDKDFGMDTIFHTDFTALSTTWTTLAAQYH